MEQCSDGRTEPGLALRCELWARENAEQRSQRRNAHLLVRIAQSLQAEVDDGFDYSSVERLLRQRRYRPLYPLRDDV
jgi:hypothetical protein